MNTTTAASPSVSPHNRFASDRVGSPKEIARRRAYSTTPTRKQPQAPCNMKLPPELPKERHETGQELAMMFQRVEPALRFGLAVALVVGWSVNFVGRHPVMGGGPMELANSALEACILSLIWMAILARTVYVCMLDQPSSAWHPLPAAHAPSRK
ncbi:MAG: hypothetical protein NTX54_06020 [Chloroflexi bacterium]|nr:hypothetical protein [Chloroflexota bacterium]